MDDRLKLSKLRRQEIYVKFDKHEVPEFAKEFRGYSKDEVDDYLEKLVDAYSKMYDDFMEQAEELDRLRAYKNQIADAILEAKITAEEIINKAQSDSYELIPKLEVVETFTGEVEPDADFERLMSLIASGDKTP